MSSPSTRIWNFSRSLRCCSSVLSRIYFGGLQLVDYSQCHGNAGAESYERGLKRFCIGNALG